MRVTSNGAISGRLDALLARRAKGGKRIGRARFALPKAGTRIVKVKLTRSGRRALARSKSARLRVRYVAGDLRGYASARR